MSQERTEQPTSKRLRDARERGQIARSKEVQDVVQLAAALATLTWMGGFMIRALADGVAAGVGRIDAVAHKPVLPAELTAAASGHLLQLALIVGPVMATAVAAGLAAVWAQGGWTISWQPLKPSFNRLSPASGIKRFAPGRAGLDLLRVAIVTVALAWVAWGVLRPFVEEASRLGRVAPAAAAETTWDAVLALVKRAVIVFGVVAAADYLVKRYQLRQSLRMTKQEVKDEHKLLEGNPEIKGRVRRLQRDLARRRMLAAVPKATVVITNPTHVAVALEYRREAMAAPKVLAKGADHVAQRIKEVARAHGIPTVENVALARALYAHAEIDEAIPADLFEAVAEVLAYLVRLKQLSI